MKKSVLPAFFLFGLCLLKGSFVFAQNPGTSGADILKTPIGVRATAMAGTYAAFGDDVYVIGYNPAGLARISKYSVGLDHIEGIAGIETEALSVAVPTRDYGNFGGQIIYRHMPPIQNTLATDAPIQSSDVVLIVADAQQFGAIAVGGSLKTLFSTLGEKQALVEAIDLGMKFQFLQTDMAFVLQNMGPGIQYQPNTSGASDPLPFTARFGMSRPLIVSPVSTLLAAAEALYVNDEGPQASFALEYWYRSVLAFRAGYRFSDPGNLSGGFSAGAGFRFTLGQLDGEVGYAWHPSSVDSNFLVNSNTFGLLLWF
jgi:hypothetical protein